MPQGTAERRAELGRFLRARREALPGTGRPRSRTPGLRREDVAELAAISVDYYTRLEQGRADSMPSPAIADALVGALRLTPAERAHLHHLTGRTAPVASRPEEPAPGLLFLLRHLGGLAAQVLNDLGDVLAQNPAADQFFPWIIEARPGPANVYERWFCHAHVRSGFPEALRESYSVAQAGELRAAVARRDLHGDDRGRRLVDELFRVSAEFRWAWMEMEVLDGRDKTLWVRTVPGSTLRAHVTVDEHSDQRLIVFEVLDGVENQP